MARTVRASINRVERQIQKARARKQKKSQKEKEKRILESKRKELQRLRTSRVSGYRKRSR